jgi:glyceraldehyde 3-phosphate dehydrogenase
LIGWGDLGVQVVIESTGKFGARDDAALHLKSGARKVLISAPGKGADLTVVMGVNDSSYDPASHDIISCASCTTNCVAPMAKVLDDAFGLTQGLMTTVHAYTGDQMLLDGPHKDLRRARSAAVSIVPTSTGAARTTGLVMPELAGRLDGVAVRVPVEDGSLTDLTAVLGREVTVDEVNEAFRRAADGQLAGVLRYSADALVSRDIIGESASCVFDSGLTQAAGSLVKIFGWSTTSGATLADSPTWPALLAQPCERGSRVAIETGRQDRILAASCLTRPDAAQMRRMARNR